MKSHMAYSPAVLLAAVFIATAAVSCSSNECLENKNSLPLAGFYSSEEPLQSVSMSGIYISGLGVRGDSLLADATAISQVYLPFSIDSDESSFIFDYIDSDYSAYGDYDTVTFRYSREPFFESAACGAMYNFRIMEIRTTHAVIDSVVCPDGMITNAEGENIRIYFKKMPAYD